MCFLLSLLQLGKLAWTKTTVSSCSYLYQIAHLGDDDDEPEFSSAMPLEEGDTFLFQPRPLKNLVVVDETDSLAPIMHTQVILHQTGEICKRSCQLLLSRLNCHISECFKCVRVFLVDRRFSE